MKKFAIVAVMAIAAAVFSGCGNSKQKTSGKNAGDEDSVAYALGISQGQQITMALTQMGVDSTQLDAFFKGMKEGVKGAGDKKKDAYNKGLMMGLQASMFLKQNVNPQLFSGDSTKSLSMNKFMEGFIASAKHKKGKMTPEQAQMVLQRDIPIIQARYAEKMYGPNKKESEAYMAKVAKQPGVKALPNGIYYKEVKAGNGKVATAQDMVKINYEGKTPDGKTFDKQENATMPVGQSIPGFSTALQHMPKGATWEIYIPFDQAYGAQGAGAKIKPFQALHFTVTLLDVVERPTAAPAPQTAPAPQAKAGK